MYYKINKQLRRFLDSSSALPPQGQQCTLITLRTGVLGINFNQFSLVLEFLLEARPFRDSTQLGTLLGQKKMLSLEVEGSVHQYGELN